MKRVQKNYTAFTYETEMERADVDTAEKLLKELKILHIGSARFHVDGTFYNLPVEYPVILFDLYGYIYIESEHQLRCKADVRKRVHIPNGIHRLNDYKKYSFIPKCLKKIHESEKKRIKEMNKTYKPFHDIMQGIIAKSSTSSLQEVRFI